MAFIRPFEGYLHRKSWNVLRAHALVSFKEHRLKSLLDFTGSGRWKIYKAFLESVWYSNTCWFWNNYILVYQGKNDMYVLRFRFYVFSNPEICNLPAKKVCSIPKKLLHHVVAMKVIRMTICSRLKNDLIFWLHNIFISIKKVFSSNRDILFFNFSVKLQVN